MKYIKKIEKEIAKKLNGIRKIKIQRKIVLEYYINKSGYQNTIHL